jgi:hypothetical protein
LITSPSGTGTRTVTGASELEYLMGRAPVLDPGDERTPGIRREDQAGAGAVVLGVADGYGCGEPGLGWPGLG